MPSFYEFLKNKTRCFLYFHGQTQFALFNLVTNLVCLFFLRWSSGGREEGFENEEIGYVQVVNDAAHCQFTRYDIKS